MMEFPMIKIPSEQDARSFFLWTECPEAAWKKLYSRMRWLNTPCGNDLFPLEETTSCLCVLWQGRARVFSRDIDAEHATLLRTMQGGDLFGVHSVFPHGVPPQSRIIATARCLTLLVPADAFKTLLATDPHAMEAYIRFLTDRVQFLNQKIRYLTAGNAERRLALYLLSVVPENDRAVTLPHTSVALADLLNISRASLYRAMTCLSNDGFLTRKGQRFSLHRRDELASFYS